MTPTNPLTEARERIRREIDLSTGDGRPNSARCSKDDLRTLLAALPTDDDVERDALVSRAYEHCAKIADCMAQDSTVEERRWAAGRIAEIIRAQAIHHPVTKEAGTCATS